MVVPFTSVQAETFSVPGSLSNAWADFDNDGDLDLAVSLKGGEIRLYRNDKGVFTNIGATLGLPTSGGEYRGLDWGDYDGDGWVDLYAGSALPDKPSMLFHNEAGKRFTDMAPQLGLTLPGRSSRQNNWVDYDNDGDLDLYVTDRIGSNKLFRNDNGKFVQVFEDAPPTVRKSTVGACWFDYDKDGFLDLFLANQSGQTDSLFHNEKGKGFVDVAPRLGMAMAGRDKMEGGVGCAVGDYDNDGNLDIFVPNYGKNVLWRNLGDGTFVNVAPQLGLDVENHAVGAAWGDYDNDGYIDLFITSYHGEPGQQTPANALFHNDDGRKFTNVIDAYPMLNAGDHGVTWVDYNSDGAIDLSVMRGYSPVGGHFLFRNDLPAERARQSLSVMVLDGKGHYTQAGAEVRLYSTNGALLGTQLVSTGGGYGAQNVAPVHFALPSLAPVTVEVTFMSTDGRQTRNLKKVRPNSYFGTFLKVIRK
ncbi:MAG: CRTAC1 family protein [Sphingobium sp.]